LPKKYLEQITTTKSQLAHPKIPHFCFSFFSLFYFHFVFLGISGSATPSEKQKLVVRRVQGNCVCEMQQPQQKRHKLLTIAKPNKQNVGRNKGKTLKTAAGYKSAMGWSRGSFWCGGHWVLVGGFWPKMPPGPLHRAIHSHIQSKHSHITENAPAA